MIICEYCKGVGILENRTPFSLPQKCGRCQGTGRLKLDALRFGDHCTLLYRNPKKQIEITASFLMMGLAKNERCVCVADEDQQEEIKKSLIKKGVNVREQTERGALVFSSKDEFYLPGGDFNPERSVRAFQATVDDATESGFEGLRGTADMQWALVNPEFHTRLVKYEAMIHQHIQKNCLPFLALCQYHLDRFPPQTIHHLRDSHNVRVEI